MKISRQALTSSKQLQDRSFHVMERTRTAAECAKMKNAVNMQIREIFVAVVFVVAFHIVEKSCCKRTGGSAIKLIVKEGRFTVVRSGHH